VLTDYREDQGTGMTVLFRTPTRLSLLRSGCSEPS
jgi:hypothetical protein